MNISTYQSNDRTVVEKIKNPGIHFAVSEKYTFSTKINTKLEWNDGQGVFKQNEPGHRQEFLFNSQEKRLQASTHQKR